MLRDPATLTLLGLLPLMLYLASSSEITTPRLLQGRPGAEAALYELQLSGGRYLLYLRKSSLLPPGFSLYLNGVPAPHSPQLAKHDCAYRGHFLDVPNTTAELTTCTGLAGVLRIMDDVYSIKPMPRLEGFQHLVTRLEPAGAHKTTVPQADALEHILTSTISTARYLKLAVFVARDMWAPLGGTALSVMGSVLQIMQTLNVKYRPLNIRIFLILLDIWADDDPVYLGSQTPLADRFAEFNNYINQAQFTQRKSDTSLLLTNESSFGTGMTHFGKVCSRQYGSIAVYQGNDLGAYALHIAHILGHSIGIMHDNGRNCQCAGPICIMEQNIKNASEVLTFSSCSVADFEEFTSTFGATCLLIPPDRKHDRYPSLCGNRRLDPGEDCDCGTPLECKADPCCRSTCKFTTNANCASGGCCKNCQRLPRGSECRAQTDECDFPEYCDGVLPTCPSDVFQQNGNVCNDKHSYCFNGQCQDLDAQCKQLFGASSKAADESCFLEANILQDRFENCAGDSSECGIPDVRCGKIQCAHPSHLPTFSLKAAIQYYGPKHCRCASVELMPSSLAEVEDLPLVPLLVPDGTKCGIDKLCLRQKCQRISILNLKCDAKTDCNSRGRCNNKGNCHCDIGWEPPTCKAKRSGGSIVSGGQHSLIKGTAVGDGLSTWLVVIFCCFIPLFTISLVLVIKWEDIIHFCIRHFDID